MNKDGEDEIVLCESCGYCANQEVAEFVLENKKEDSLPLEEVETIDKKTIEDVCNYLGVSPKKSIKAVVFAVKWEDNAYVVCFTRGDREINETKLRKILGKETFPFDASGVKELCAGFIGPKGLNAPNAKVFYDKTLENLSNAVCGANKTNYHYKNFNFDRDMEKVEFVDISKARNGDACPLCHNKLKVSGGIEVGNIFQLGTKYTKTMDMTVLDKNGVAFNPIMGCYGIGVGRNLACIVEENSDERGICLPMSVAPFKVHISPIKYEEENVKEQTDKLYSALKAKNIPVLLDDRIVSPGIKFADADLIGMPIRVVISPRTLENGEAEIKMRKSGEIIMCNIDDALSKIEEIIQNEMLSY